MPLIPNLHDPGVLEGFFVEDDPNTEAPDSVEISRGKLLTRDGRILSKINLPTGTPVGQLVLQNAEKFRLDLGDDYPDTTVYILLKPREYGTLEVTDGRHSRFNPSHIALPSFPKKTIRGIGRSGFADPIERNDQLNLEFVEDLNNRSTEEVIDPQTNMTSTVNASILLASVTLVSAEVTAVDNSIKELAQ